MALSLLVGVFSGALASAFVTTSGAAPLTACVATPVSTTTCAVTLPLTSATWTVHNTGGTAPTTFPATANAGLKATEKPSTGKITGGTLTIPPTPESNTGSVETISFTQITPGAATGSVSAKGIVTVTDQLTIKVKITKPISQTCVSTPVTVTFRSATPYDPSTGDVTLSDTTFAVPNFSATNCGAAAGQLNERFAGPTGNAITLDLHGTLLIPPSPTKATVTALAASPKVPVATGGNVAGQPTTLTATVTPGGQYGATGSVQFFLGTTPLGSPVNLSSPTGSTPTTAKLTTTTLPAGVDHLKAVYSGDGNYITSTSVVLNYTVAGAPTVNVAFPSSITLLSSGTAVAKLTGAVTDPANGPVLSHARLDLVLNGIKTLSGKVTLKTCTATYLSANCTTITVTVSGGTVKASYGGTTGFSLITGQVKPLYLELSVASGSNFGYWAVTAKLDTVTASTGATVQATLATQTATVTVLPVTKSTTTLTLSTTSAGAHATRQGYEVRLSNTLAKSPSGGPTTTGTLTYVLTGVPIGATALPTESLFFRDIDWSVGIHTLTTAYSGDSIFDQSTSNAVTFTVTPPLAGVAYTCTVVAGGTRTPGGNAIVSSVTTPTLPVTALAGSTVAVDHLAVTANVDDQFFSSGYTINALGLGLTPGGTAVGALPTGLLAGSNPDAVAVNPTTNTIYVANTTANNVSVIDGTTNKVTGAVHVGTNPDAVAVDPLTNTIYVANYNSNTVSVINGTTDAVTATVTVGVHPPGVAVDPSTDEIYVANATTGTVSVIDGATNTTTGAAITVGSKPHGVAVDPTTDKIYVTNYGSTTMSVINGATGHLTATLPNPITVGANPRGVGVDLTTNKIYVANSGSNTVSVINGATNTPTGTAITVGAGPYGVAVNPTAGTSTKGTIYATRYGSATLPGTTVSVINGNTKAVTTVSVGTGAGPSGVGVDPTTNTIFTANYDNNTVSVITGNPPAVTSTVNLGAGSIVTPKTGTTTLPLTTYGSFYGTGTVTLSSTPGQVTVGLGSFGWVKSSGTFATTITCVPVFKPAVIGTVNVVAPAGPTVATQPANQTVDPGGYATFTATASGQLAPTVQWQESTDAGSTWTTVPGATTATQGTGSTTTTYTTPAATAADNGTEYRAVFTNASGVATTTAATLTVNVPPTVTAQPADQTVTAGTPATFSASASARPTPGVQWQSSTDGGTTWANVPGATSATLTVTPTKAQDANEYRAVFTNDLGSATTTAATLTVTTTAYRLVGADGAVYDFGTAPYEGSMGGVPLNAPIVGTADTPTGGGYWEVAADGGIFSFGTAQFYGSMGGQALDKPIVGMASTPTGGGYWEVASDGGIFSFGDAVFYGSMGGQPLNKPIVGMAATPTGNGYWLVASDGGIFAFGDAVFYGSTGSMTLDKPIVGMAATPTGNGYWLVASDGGIFAFGNAPFYGSAAGGSAGTVVAMASTPTGNGYWLAGSNGSVTAFGRAPLAGSMAGQPLNAPIVAMTG